MLLFSAYTKDCFLLYKLYVSYFNSNNRSNSFFFAKFGLGLNAFQSNSLSYLSLFIKY
jgi:hypothetical protein